MSSKTDLMEDRVLNWVRGTAFPSAPGTVYVGLFSAAPSDAGGGTELANATSPGYTRKAITFGAPSGGSMSNSAEVLFDTATGTWVNATHFGIFDAATAGNLLYWGPLTSAVQVANGNQGRIAAGAITISES